MTKRTQNSIKWTCNEIRDLLVSKNKAYGDSALEPENIFSKLDNAQGICARIDDKLSRIKNTGLNDATEDTLDDLIGYLILLKIARQNRAEGVTVYTTCNCVHGWHNCTCQDTGVCTIELNPDDDAYVPPWSQEIEKDVKVKVFVSDPGDEIAPITQKSKDIDLGQGVN
jgi:hypothetical protein